MKTFQNVNDQRLPSGGVTPPSGENNGEEGKEGGQEEGQEALAATGAVLTNCPTLFTKNAAVIANDDTNKGGSKA